MAVQPVAPADRQVIQGYGPGHFRVNGVDHQGSVIITPQRTVAWSATTGSLDEGTLTEIITVAEGAEILLLGAGRRTLLLPPGQRQTLRAAGLVVDVMDTGAACRTYNVLVMEGRRVAAALVALDEG